MPVGKITNDLIVARRKRGLSRKQVASLLGLQTTSTLIKYERGVHRPPLDTLLKLEILYRTPVAFLYSERYGELRRELRAVEEGGRDAGA